jgi:ABC-type glycerol-3-phosphate transport system substrate-binding protein
MKHIQRSATLVLLTLLVAACSPSPTPEEPIVITFAIPAFVTGKTKANFRGLADSFNQANPHLEVQLRAISIQEAREVDDPFNDIMLNEEWGIDAFFAYGGSFAERMAGSDRVLKLQPLLEADPSWELGDFYSPVLAQFQYDSGLWGIPTEFAPLVVFFNKDLFDEAGVAYPQSGWTRDDFLATTLALKEALPERHFPFVGIAEATVPLEWYLDLALVHEVMPTLAQAEAYEPELPPNVGVFVRVGGNGELSEGVRRTMEASTMLNVAAHWGDVAMWISPLWEQGGWRQDSGWGFRWGVVPLPRDAIEVTMLDTFGCYVTAHSPHPQEALRWIEYLTHHRVDISGIPARRSVAQGAAFREALPQGIDTQALDALLTQLERGQPIRLTSVRSMAAQCLGDTLIDIYEHGEDVETALRKAQQKLSEQ